MKEQPEPRPAYRIRTDRLELRPHQPSDLEAWRAAIAETLEELRPWMPWAHEGKLAPVEEHLALLRRWRAGFDVEHEYVYAAFELESGAYAGSVGLHPRIGPGGLETGYWVRASRTGRGYATEMAAAVTRVAFELLCSELSEIRCEPENVASAAVPRKLGYTFDGLLRRRLAWPDGERRDVEVWSLFADEYPTSPNAGAVLAAYDVLDRRLL